ncbi:MAG: DUF4136 domain-containing protein [Candidatus Acidiferrales bacterium]
MWNKLGPRMARTGIAILAALFVCGAALAQDVTTNAMPGTNFAKYHTYKWVAVQGATYPDQIVDTQIKTSINSQLAAKGLTKTDSDKADLYVAYQASIGQERQWNAYGMGGGLRWGGMANATSSTINIGTLVLDMYDPTTKQLVWTGRVSKALDPKANQEKKQKNLDKAMQKLLKSFPPS